MGLVELSVSDLDRSLAYWQDAIGLRVLSRENGTAELGADAPLLRFVEEPGARPADGFTGLFHVALLVPDRPSLGRFLAGDGRGVEARSMLAECYGRSSEGVDTLDARAAKALLGRLSTA